MLQAIGSVMQKRLTILIISLLALSIPSLSFAEDTGSGLTDFADMLSNLQNSLPWVKRLIVAFCYTTGVWLLLKSVYMLKKYGQMRTMMAVNASIAKPMIVLMTAVGLIYIPSIIDIFIDSLWAVGASQSVIAYPTSPAGWDAIINPLIDIVRLLGLVAFARGWLLLARFGAEQSQPGTGGKALMHMIGGVLAMNITGTLSVAQATLGIS